jgi:preprotein translocase subunit SecY
MMFRVFRLLVGLALGFAAAWLIWGGIDEIIGAVSGQQGAAALVAPILRIVGGFLILGLFYYALWAESGIRRGLENIFSIPELLQKIAFTLALLCIYRVGFHVPLPGVNQEMLREQMGQQQDAGGGVGQAIQYFSLFTGGSLQQSTLFGLGIMPYISASIIFQLLTTVVPSLERLQKEGPAGVKKIQEYTRYATVLLCIIQAIFWMKYMLASGLLYPEYSSGSAMVLVYSMGLVGLTAGTVFLMWLGEQIDEYGIGNGISLLIMAGIVVRLPHAISELANRAEASLTGTGEGIGVLPILVLIGLFVFVVAGAILITQGQRRIPIQQAKQIRGRRVFGGMRHYMPLRVNQGGVMPIIFASALMIFPGVIFGWLRGVWYNGFTRTLESAFRRGSYTWSVVYIALIFFFAYFWTTIQFRPKETADQLRDMGHFIPGLRPGKRTADYLERVMERITYCGAAFLAIIAVLPQVVSEALDVPWQISSFLGGTALLIVISVALDLVQRIEANLVMHNYGGFLGGSTRIKGSR